MASVADRVVEGPTRRCILTGQSAPAAELLRLVAGPDDRLAVDFDGRLPGRGAWVTAEKSRLADALAKGILGPKAARALKSGGKLAVPGDLVDHIETRLRARCLERLGLERRAGRLVTGFDQCADVLAGGKAALLITASDAAADGAAKLEGPARRLGVPILRQFSRHELGLALGRENVVHAALKPGAAVAHIVSAAERLAHFCGAADSAAMADKPQTN